MQVIINIGWKGTLGLKDEPAPEGIYNWKIYFNDILTNKKHKLSDDVLLFR